MSLKFISICSGIEAASMAWEPLGWTPLAFSEIEPFPCAVLKHHYPHVPNLGDMTKFDEWPEDVLAECDVLVGGCPCQAFSVAGLRQSLADARGNLTLVFVKLINHIDAIRSKHGRPPIIIVYENVPGILSTGDNAFGNFLGALSGEDGALEPPGGKWTNAGLVCGPTRDLAWRVLDAQYFGVAQRRRRVFVVACAGGRAERAAAVLFEPEGVCGHTPPSRATREAATARAALGAGERSADGVICMAHGQGGAEVRLDGSPSLTCNHEAPIVFDTTQITSALNRSVPKPGDPCHPLAAGAHAPAVAFTGDGVTADPISAHEGSTYTPEGSTFRLHNCVQQTMAVRRLTPVECERLQGFPDEYTRIPWKNKPMSECPDGPRYKALGNSMAVPCMMWIGQQIQKALA